MGPVSLASEPKPLPVAVNVVFAPGASWEGMKPVMSGPATVVRHPLQVATCPSAPVSVIVYWPSAAACPTETASVTAVAADDLTVAVTPPLGPVTFTFSGGAKSEPVTVTGMPEAPRPRVAGEIELIDGEAGVYVIETDGDCPCVAVAISLLLVGTA